MAVRTVSVTLRLTATAYLAAGNRVLALNNDIDDSYRRISASSQTAAAGTRDMGDALRTMSVRARLAERRVHDLREEVDRLIAAQAALRAGGPIPPNVGNAGQAGQRMGGGILMMLIRTFTRLPAEAQAAILGAAAAIATMLATTIGAALNALLLAAVGGAVLAVGVALAAKYSDVVQRAFGDVFKPIGDEIIRFATVFEGPLVKAARVFGDVWTDVGGDVRDMFAQVSTAIEPLAEGLGGMVRDMMPGLKAAVAAALPVLKELGAGLPMIGRALSQMFSSFADGEGAVKGMRFLILLVSAALIELGYIIKFLSDAFNFFTEAGERVYGTLAKIPLLGKAFEPLVRLFEWLNRETGGSIKGLEGVATASGPAAEGIDRTGVAATEADKAMRRLNTAMDETERRMTGTVDAALAYEEAIDNLTESVKENGRSLDIGAEKGRNNVKAVESVARAAWASREAAIAAAGGQNASAAAVDAANEKFRQQINQLAALMRQLGFTEDQIRGALAGWYALANAPDINKVVRVDFRTTGSRTAVTAVTQGGRTYTRQFERQGGIEYAQHGLVDLTGKAGIAPGVRTVYGFGEPGNREAFISSQADRYRSMAIGSEAMRWHKASVVPYERMGAGTTYNININAGLIADQYAVGREVVRVLRREVKGAGGNVQIFLAGKPAQ